jgi:hypothetical protein
VGGDDDDDDGDNKEEGEGGEDVDKEWLEVVGKFVRFVINGGGEIRSASQTTININIISNKWNQKIQ